MTKKDSGEMKLTFGPQAKDDKYYDCPRCALQFIETGVPDVCDKCTERAMRQSISPIPATSRPTSRHEFNG